MQLRQRNYEPESDVEASAALANEKGAVVGDAVHHVDSRFALNLMVPEKKKEKTKKKEHFQYLARTIAPSLQRFFLSGNMMSQSDDFMLMMIQWWWWRLLARKFSAAYQGLPTCWMLSGMGSVSVTVKVLA